MGSLPLPQHKYLSGLHPGRPYSRMSPMAETVSHRMNRANSAPTEQDNSTPLVSPTSMFSGHARNVSGTTSFTSAGSTSGADSCEALLFKVIAHIQGMKAERDEQAKLTENLQSEIEELNTVVSDQKQEIANLREELESLKQVRKRCSSTYALCLIDGDGYIFDKKFLEKGYEGGREAASTLTKQLHQDINDSSTNLWTCVYYNHHGLRKALMKYQEIQEQTFDEFCDGFRSASQLIHMMDVGRKKEAADEKIKDMLRVFATAPQTRIIYFGGGHDSGYVGSLSHYQNIGLEDKIVVLKGYDEIAYDLRDLPFRVLGTDGLFMPEKLDAETQTTLQPTFTQQFTAVARNPNGAGATTGSYASAATLAVPLTLPGRRSPSPGQGRGVSRERGRGDLANDGTVLTHLITSLSTNKYQAYAITTSFQLVDVATA